MKKLLACMLSVFIMVSLAGCGNAGDMAQNVGDTVEEGASNVKEGVETVANDIKNWSSSLIRRTGEESKILVDDTKRLMEAGAEKIGINLTTFMSADEFTGTWKAYEIKKVNKDGSVEQGAPDKFGISDFTLTLDDSTYKVSCKYTDSEDVAEAEGNYEFKDDIGNLTDGPYKGASVHGDSGDTNTLVFLAATDAGGSVFLLERQ